MSLTPDDSLLFGFDASESWLHNLRGSRRETLLGSLGSFELIEEVARGGQGVVFRARQPGTGRTVALKRLLAGSLATSQQKRRFEREVEAAAALHHPGLVTVYGTEVVEGVPVLAMEWVEGLPITDWARAQGRDAKARRRILQLFVELCAAIQHAHMHGILHRDLKPSNVLVDRDGRPRVLDFGLAKLAHERPGGEVSRSRDALGTPAYAAPEQVDGAGVPIDARADVWALGALLFELLTGRRLREGSQLEALARALQPHAVPRPSAVDRSVGRELDAIVLQATEFDRERRFQSVGALASDVERYLAGEPVLAHPPGALYVLRKLARRHRAASASLAALLAASVAFVWIGLYQAAGLAAERDRAQREADAAGAARKTAEDNAERARQAEARAQVELVRAENEAQNAQSMLEFLVEDVFDANVTYDLGHEPTVAEMFATAVGRIGARFAQDPEREAEVRITLARALHSFGRHKETVEILRPALAYREHAGDPGRLGAVQNLLGASLAELGSFAEAGRMLDAAIENLAPLSEHKEQLCSALRHRGSLLVVAMQPAESLPFLERARALGCDESSGAVARELSDAYYMLGRNEPAHEVARQALAEESARHGDDTRLAAELRVAMAQVEVLHHDCERALANLRRAHEIFVQRLGAEHPSTVRTLNDLAHALAHCDQAAEAEEVAARALDSARNAGNSCELPTYLFTYGTALIQLGRLEESESALREALDLALECFGATSPRRLLYADMLAEALLRLGQYEEAEELLQESLAAQRALPPAEAELGPALYQLGRVALARDDPERAVEYLSQANDWFERNGLDGNLALSLAVLLEAQRLRGDTAAVEELAQRLALVQARLPEGAPPRADPLR